ncbi:MAG TPA: class I SAM-dependent rRNA methyltransferase [Bryobacteraceae bacterium]|nr:class I SAM-dependent rRNA methyltransferase [Bryobacteraceae bacterium]
MKTVRIHRKGAGRLLAGHPWIFSSDIADRGGAEAGEAVRIAGPRGALLGTAHYSSSSQIALRLLSREAVVPDKDFFRARIEAAEAFRRRVVSDSDAYRVVHGEADLLPALIVDRYGEWLVIQTLDQGMDRAKPEIVAALQEIYSPRGIVERNEAAVRRHENLPQIAGLLAGEEPGVVEIRMNGLRLHADLLRGQKTGVFLDQRENYVAVARYAHGRALDCFTSTGGFALHMAARCETVEGVDSSAPALEVAESNRTANGIGNVSFREANVFGLLSGLRNAGRPYSTIVLDPPAFAKSRESLEGAARGYKEINLRALQILAPGGILVACSCSHHMSEAMLLEVVASASLDAGRTLRVLERRTQAQDHPILLTVPETHYLKCLVFEAL